MFNTNKNTNISKNISTNIKTVIKTNNINNDLNNNSLIKCKTTSKVNHNHKVHHWLDIRNFKDQQQLAQQYANICQQHQQDKKWILMINPEDKSLETLYASGKISTTKILRVNAHKQSINMSNIEMALKTGNCSAVILCNASFKEEEINQLTACAQKGKTQCIVLKSMPTLH